MTRGLAIAVVLATACTDSKTVVDPDATAIEIQVHLDPALGIDQLRISSKLGDMEGFAPGTLPDTPRPLSSSETADVLVPDSLDGMTLMVRIDGLAAGAVVGSGVVPAKVELHHVSRVDLTLGAKAICGDSVVRNPIEACDDGNATSGDGCSSDCLVEPGWICSMPQSGPSMCKLDTFDVASAASIGNHQVAITFSAPPDPAGALVLANYTIPGLAISGTPFLAGNTVTITTAKQQAVGYNVLVANVTRASDGLPLTTSAAAFLGRPSFDVVAAASLSPTAVTVTFSAPPDPTQAATLANYSIPGLTLSAPVLAGSTVTLTTTNQASMLYTVTVTGVSRASDAEMLTIDTVEFTGRNGFDVASAASTRNRQMTVTFNAAPNAAQATTLGNYSVPGLTLTAPTLSGNTVTFTTSAQSVTTYTVTVTGVTRASDATALTINTAMFAGLPIASPTVTNVAVTSTNPNNGTKPYNTGTATLSITGTDFSTVTCPTGLKLDDLNGVDTAVGTVATSCTVNSDTSITATFKAGIRTNGTTGWNVLVTNSVGSNTTSAVPFVPLAGLLVSEVYTGTAGATDHEFVELYNPTATSLDTAMTGLGIQLHARDASGTDHKLNLTFVHSVVPSHGFMLIVSATSDAGDAWFAHRDATYPTATNSVVQDGGVYVSLAAAANASVIDKVGWGAQVVGGYEGTAVAQITDSTSAERKPAGGAGHATDTDNNALDFNAPSTAITPRGTVDAAQP